jgi:hypothetical protein
MPVSESHKRASVKYDREHMKRIAFVLHRSSEADLIDWLSEIENKNAYLKALIRADMAASKK